MLSFFPRIPPTGSGETGRTLLDYLETKAVESAAALRAFGPACPYGTLIVNVVGSFALAVIATLAIRAGVLSPTLQLTLGTSFCGGFTAYFECEKPSTDERGRLLRCTAGASRRWPAAEPIGAPPARLAVCEPSTSSCP